MTVNLVQYSFTHGEISPQMIARGDLEIYRKCAKQLRNMLVIPQGGARRRFGLEYIADLTSEAGAGEYLGGWYQVADDENYLLIFLPLKINIYKDDAFLASVTTPYTAIQLANREVKFSQSGNSLIVVHPDIPPKELIFTPSVWELTDITFRNLPAYDFKKNYDENVFSLASSDVKKGVLLTATLPIFDNSYVGGLFEGYGKDLADELGRARITKVTNPTKAEVTIIAPFATTFEMPGTEVFLAEPAWGTARGWPASVDYYEGRVIFGGSKSLPQTLFGSVIDDNYNFDLGRGLDSDAIQITLQKTNAIKDVIGDRNLQVFTTNEEYASLQLQGQPLTPTNLPFRKQSSNGIANVAPVILDNQTFYVQRGGKRVMTYVFNNTQSAYQSVDASIVATHLIRNPVDSASFKNDREEDSNYLFLTNSDGTIASYQTLAAENVSAWSLLDTQGKFKRVISVDNDIYFIIEREIGGIQRQYLEKLNFNIYTDSTLIFNYGVPTDIITGLDHLNGKNVRVIGDGYNLGEYLVGKEIPNQIELPVEVLTAVVGLEYIPLLETLPIELQGNRGSIAYEHKRILSVTLDFYKSLGIYVNNTLLVPFRKFLGTLDYPPSNPQTDIKEIRILNKWLPRSTITITQKDPLPMTILAINYEIEI
jgi:hypothetical protein